MKIARLREGGQNSKTLNQLTKNLVWVIMSAVTPCMPTFKTNISANADGPWNAASGKNNHIALPTEYNYQAMSTGR